MVVKNDVKRHASPPRRDDDREGHYVFNLGENLTPRCECFFVVLVGLPFELDSYYTVIVGYGVCKMASALVGFAFLSDKGFTVKS